MRSLTAIHPCRPQSLRLVTQLVTQAVETRCASINTEINKTVELTSEMVVLALPDWFATHQIDMPITWAAEFEIRPGNDIPVITSDTVKASIYLLTNIAVTGDENVSIRSVATWSTEVVARQGCKATDVVSFDFRWSSEWPPRQTSLRRMRNYKSDMTLNTECDI
uniref:Uncharacterized protein n=1 Tax=Sipha flava TaxID=143950 RepID=A0A2S2QXT2_9HEMI